jgi:hypothetical protein
MEFQLNTKNIWFPDQREPVYDPQDEESMQVFKDYWKREKDRCMNGFTIADGQVKIPGRLYNHTVYGKIAAYEEKERGGKTRKTRQIITPILRDLEWDIFNDLEKCTEEGILIYNLVGSRDFGKSVIAASCASWLYTHFDKSESVISAGAYNYIKLATDKIEDFLLNVHPIFRKQRLTSDWKKEIVAGWKDKSTQLADPASSFSSIKVRNYENGNKTMAANGTRPAFHLIDEEGTLPNLIGCIKDSDGCWWSGDGDNPSCLVMLTGTGGDMEVGKEAGEVFFDPLAYNCLAFDNPEVPNGKMGRFISALRARMKYKEPWTLFRYLTEKLGMDLKPHPDLDITILVSNEDRAFKEWWEPEYRKALSSGNSKTVLKFKAYWPLKASDSFLILTKNDYNIEAAKKQQQKLRTIGTGGVPVELVHEGTKITHKWSKKLPITEFPVRTQSKDAPVVIYEFPIENPPFGLYVAGVDNYRQGQAAYSDSLGAVYIFKRMHDIHSELYQDMFVASYAARPERPDDWNEQARMLIKYYNARTLCENDDMTFINYMIAKGDGHYLEDQPQWLRNYVPNTTVQRDKGIHRSAIKIRDMLHAGLKNYLDDTVIEERDENGSIYNTILGVTRVLDPMLLEEIIQFNDEEDSNFDREVAASLAIALANHLDPIIGRVGGEGDSRIRELFKKPIKGNKLFKGHSNIFRPKKRKLFNR